MKVKIKDLHPNPYRDMKRYPISEYKVKALIESIEQTGFWDNILARDSGGKIQLAYGHHRLVALKKAKRPEDIVDIPVKVLSDALMIQIMANENMDDWKTTPGVIDETVLVAKQFLESHPDEANKYGQIKSGKNGEDFIGEVVISRFLHWPTHRIRHSLERLGAIQNGTVSKEAIEKLPNEGIARSFVKAVKKNSIPISKQNALVDKILDGKRNDWAVNDAAIDVKFHKPVKAKRDFHKEKLIQFEQYEATLRNDSDEYKTKLIKYIRLRNELNNPPPTKVSRLLYEMLGFVNKRILLIIKPEPHETQNTTRGNLKHLANGQGK